MTSAICLDLPTLPAASELPTSQPLPVESMPASFEAMREQLWIGYRRARRVEDQVLLRDTLLWRRGLPKGVRPHELPLLFPRIANELCRVWNDAPALDAYLDSLLFDKRGGRKGFPPLVREELQALSVFIQAKRSVQQEMAA